MTEAGERATPRPRGARHLLSMTSAVGRPPASMAPCVLNRRSMISPAIVLIAALAAADQGPATVPTQPAATAANQTSTQVPATVSCSSTTGRTHCPADTSAGVALIRSTGDAPCLLGKTWGYDQQGVWVADGCSGEFATGSSQLAKEAQRNTPRHVPNVGFLLFDGDKGQIYFRLFSYGRYLNQLNLDDSYVDAFGNTKTVARRQDMQLQKFFAPFSGWYLTPKFRYYLYVWSANTSQGDAAQVVGAGNLTWTFTRHAALGVGITSLPSVRSTEGQFPYWLGVDDRLIADEFFRGSYTTGFWLKGELHTKVKYHVMFANNLSTLGVSAAQLDNRFDTQSYSVQWLPTTGEFGLWGTFGDYDDHQKVATRVGGHYTHSLEEKQSQPGTENIENSQIRLSDGSIIFTPDLFGPGTTVDAVDYHMVSVDAGVKYRGFSVEGEVYWRWLRNFTGVNTAIVPEIDDTGYQLQVSAMAIPKILQPYFGTSQIFGQYGDPWEVRGGANWYPWKERGIRVNGELMHVNRSPVGYTAYPYPVGARGTVFHLNLEMNF